MVILLIFSTLKASVPIHSNSKESFVKTELTKSKSLRLWSILGQMGFAQLCSDFRVKMDIKSVKFNYKKQKNFEAIFFSFSIDIVTEFAYPLNKKCQKANNSDPNSKLWLRKGTFSKNGSSSSHIKQKRDRVTERESWVGSIWSVNKSVEIIQRFPHVWKEPCPVWKQHSGALWD